MDARAVAHQARGDRGLDAFAQAANRICMTQVIKPDIDVVATRLASIPPGVGHVLWGLTPATNVLNAEEINPATVDGPSNVEACFGLIRNDALPFIVERDQWDFVWSEPVHRSATKLPSPVRCLDFGKSLLNLLV